MRATQAEKIEEIKELIFDLKDFGGRAGDFIGKDLDIITRAIFKLEEVDGLVEALKSIASFSKRNAKGEMETTSESRIASKALSQRKNEVIFNPLPIESDE